MPSSDRNSNRSFPPRLSHVNVKPWCSQPLSQKKSNSSRAISCITTCGSVSVALGALAVDQLAFQDLDVLHGSLVREDRETGQPPRICDQFGALLSCSVRNYNGSLGCSKDLEGSLNHSGRGDFLSWEYLLTALRRISVKLLFRVPSWSHRLSRNAITRRWAADL